MILVESNFETRHDAPMTIAGPSNFLTVHTLYSTEHAFHLIQTGEEDTLEVEVWTMDQSALITTIRGVARDNLLGADGQIRWDSSSELLLLDQQPLRYDEVLPSFGKTKADVSPEELIDALLPLGEAWTLESEYGEAIKFYDGCLETLKASDDERLRSKIPSLYIKKGLALHALSNYSGAIDSYEEALSILGDVFSLEIASIYDYLGSASLALGKSKKALGHHEYGLEMKDKMCSKDSPEIAVTQTYLGIVWSSRGDYKIAHEFFESAGKIFKETPNTDPLYGFMCHLLHNLGVSLMHGGDFDQALGLLNKALEFKEAHYHYPYHDQIAISLTARGAIYLRKGDRGEAMDDLQKAKTFLEVAFDDHPHSEMARVLIELGNVWYAYDEYLEAKEHYLKASKMLQTLYGRDSHPEVVRCWNNLGCAFFRLKNSNEAKEYFGKVDYMTGSKKSVPMRKRKII